MIVITAIDKFNQARLSHMYYYLTHSKYVGEDFTERMISKWLNYKLPKAWDKMFIDKLCKIGSDLSIKISYLDTQSRAALSYLFSKFGTPSTNKYTINIIIDDKNKIKPVV